jgi:LPS sulfotransferase NodH
VLTQARTGSNLLVSLLDGHPEIRCLGEIFNPRSSFGYENWTKKTIVRKMTHKYIRNYSVERYLDSLFWVRAGEIIRAAGFKVMYPGQVDRWPDCRYYLRSNDIKVISLVRENLLRKYLSSRIANIEEVWSSRNHRGKTLQVKVDINDLEREIARTETIYRLIDIVTVEFRGIRVTYEELSADRKAVTEGIFKYLGVSLVDTSTFEARTAKQNPARLDELIENFDEVRTFLLSAGYERFFDESARQVVR